MKRYTPFLRGSTSDQASELFRRATEPGNPHGASAMETLAMYANEKNWSRDYSDPNKGMKWVWKGPMICATEAAELALRDSALHPQPEGGK